MDSLRSLPRLLPFHVSSFLLKLYADPEILLLLSIQPTNILLGRFKDKLLVLKKLFVSIL